VSVCVAPNVGSLHGRLTLRFTATGAHTILSHAKVVAPLKIVRPFRLDDGRLLVQMLSLGPGLCGGDACSIDVTVEQGARVVLVAQSATRILAMRDSEPARQRVALTVRAGGQLEYYPGLVIPFPDSSVEQRLDVDLEPGARVGVVESFAMGRTGRGEYLQFRRLLTRTAVAAAGSPLYRDGMDLQPGAANLAGTGVLEGYRYVASGYWYGASDSSIPQRPEDDAGDGVLMAIGQPAANQIYMRVLAADGCRLGESLQKALRGIQAGWGLTPIPLQRFTS
jgi:urease accessory protein